MTNHETDSPSTLHAPLDKRWMILHTKARQEKAVAKFLAALNGTAVNVQAMVFGNMGEDSGTGVAFTRDPSTEGHPRRSATDL